MTPQYTILLLVYISILAHAFVSSPKLQRIPSSPSVLSETFQQDADTAPDAINEAPFPYQLKVARTKCLTGVASRAGPLNQAVTQILAQDNTNSAEITLEHANELIDTGAVWARMEALSEDDILAQYDSSDDMSSSSRALYADLGVSWNSEDDDPVAEEDLDAYIEQMESLRFRRILTPSWIEAGTDIRIYPEPRSFPSCEAFKDPARLLYEDTTFLVVDKPPMLPTQPDASNYNECCPGCVEKYMGPFTDVQGKQVKRPLLCHRVDASVGGCVVLSKDRNGQKVFQEWQKDRKLRKVYLAVTKKPVPLGLNVQWMWSPQTERRKSGGPPCQLVSHVPPESRRKARQFWNRCLLEVVKCEPIEIVKEDGHGYDPAGVLHYQSTIRLVTGRKHQVRAQLAGMGCPIIRDSLYEPMAGLSLDNLEMEEDAMDQAVAQCRVPSAPIGLQAHKILFGGVRAKAGTPWWGNRIVQAQETT